MGVTSNLNNELCAAARGPRNLITDVPGVRVGHATLEDGPGGPLHTGVTAIVPPGDCFTSKLPAAAYVSNGFGKSMGLVQVEELGCLETPILMTNTLSCGACFDALVRHALDTHPQIGVSTGTVNPVVMECNDGPINDIRAMGVRPEHGFEAMRAASEDCEEGAVGAGSGMTCFGLKGGIGSSSRVLSFDGREYTIGVLVMTNFGALECLRIAGVPVGEQLAEFKRSLVSGEDKGSIVAVIATDLPVDARQLRRFAKRVTVGITRCGGYIGNGSGEIVVAFSTANRMNHWAGHEVDGRSLPMIDTAARLSDNAMDVCFRAVSAASEEAIISSLAHADSLIGRTGEITWSLHDLASQAGVDLPAGL
ncbi:D-aminopeptidase [Bifidobacterium goeldii]|uniref:D-aminopeptidase n=2 Tax=Bifidobacterium goeldii TaxID=2306975 RepID=A0A430FC85_9BIFI|nr:D-aminopeptidase [Bifidobacterium goeldii]